MQGSFPTAPNHYKAVLDFKERKKRITEVMDFH